MGIHRGPPHGLKGDTESRAKVSHFLSAGQGGSSCAHMSAEGNCVIKDHYLGDDRRSAFAILKHDLGMILNQNTELMVQP